VSEAFHIHICGDSLSYKLPDTLCIVTELAAGSLADVLAKRAAAGKSALSVRKIVRYAKDIARALNYLHHKHVIHRYVLI
jgi:serine/threonine protein kinase